ncbi:MAG: hypothetical protein WBD20_09805 [Pirellulaceae bacterium]
MNFPRNLWAACLLFAVLLLAAPDLLAQSSDPDNKPILMIDPEGFAGRSIRDIAISPDGQWLAVAGGKVVRVWNIGSGNLKATIRGELLQSVKMGRANAVAFSPDNRFLIVGVSDSTEAGSTRTYAMSDLSKQHELIDGHSACSDRVVFSSDGKWLVSYG